MIEVMMNDKVDMAHTQVKKYPISMANGNEVVSDYITLGYD